MWYKLRCEAIDWIKLPQDRLQWRGPDSSGSRYGKRVGWLKTVMTAVVLLKMGNIEVSLATNRLWGRTLPSTNSLVLSENIVLVKILTRFCMTDSKYSRHQIQTSSLKCLIFILGRVFFLLSRRSPISETDNDCTDAVKHSHTVIPNLTANYTEINAAGSISKTPSGAQMCPSPSQSFGLQHRLSPPPDTLIYILLVRSAV